MKHKIVLFAALFTLVGAQPSFAKSLPASTITVSTFAADGVTPKSVFSAGERVIVRYTIDLPDSAANKKIKVSTGAKLQIAGIEFPLSLANALGAKNSFPGAIVDSLLNEPTVAVGGAEGEFKFKIPKEAPITSKLTIIVSATIGRDLAKTTKSVSVGN